MKRNISHIVLSLSIIYFSGCSVYKADSLSVSTPDYNQRIEVTGAHYDKVLTPIGVTSIAASTAGGAYLGYQSNLIKYNSGTDQVTSRIGNAVIGAAVGFGSSYLGNRLFGWGKRMDKVDAKVWVRKANRNYILVSQLNNITVMPKLADKDFKIKTLTDASQFSSIFNNSKYTDEVFKTGVDNCQRYELPQLIRLFPGTSSVDLAKDKYIRTSPTYSDIISATQKYPELKNNYESSFLDLVANCNNAIDFKKKYINSTNLVQSYLNAYKTDNQGKNDFLELNSSYSQFSSISIDRLKKSSNTIQKNYLRSKYLLDQNNDPDFYINIYDQYSQLDFQEKKTDLLQYYFNKLDISLNDGDEILWRFKRLSDNSLYPTLSVNNSEINLIISLKLKNEAEKNIRIVSQYELTNSNSQWDSWLSSNYTAGLVGEKGAMFIIYGEIENKSKYSIPVKISCSSGLEYKVTSTGFIEAARKMLGAELIKEVEGIQTASFYIPSFSARSKGAYALKLDFKDNYQRGGVNVMDLAKFVFNAKLKNLTVNAGYNDFAAKVSQSEIAAQESYQQFVKEGLPNRDLGDLWSGGDVDESVWEEKWEQIQEARRQARIESQKRDNMLKQSSVCWKFEKTYEFKYDGISYTADVYENLNNFRDYIYLFYYFGDDTNKSGYYHFDGGFFTDDIHYGGQTITEALIKLTRCKQ